MLRLPTLYSAFGSVVVLGFSRADSTAHLGPSPCGGKIYAARALISLAEIAKNYSDHVVKPTYA